MRCPAAHMHGPPCSAPPGSQRQGGSVASPAPAQLRTAEALPSLHCQAWKKPFLGGYR